MASEFTHPTRRPTDHRLLHRRRGRNLIAALVVLVGAAVLGFAPPVSAAGEAHPTLVSGFPPAVTPHVTSGDVRTVAVVGNTAFLGGNFTTSTDPNGTVFNRKYILAFDRSTGVIRRDWVPVLDNEVFKIIPAPDGQSIYVAGRFNNVNGVSSLKVARLRVSDGSRMSFQSGVNSVVTAMALQGDNLYIGGVFTSVQGHARRFAALDKDTGAINTAMTIDIAGTHRGTGDGKIWSIEASNDGDHLAVVGSFNSVGGRSRNQVAKINTHPDGTASVSDWSTTRFAGTCGGFPDYVRDVSYAPDGSYFVVVGTGASGTGFPGTCDSVTRWTDNETANADYDWIEHSGGDSYYSAEVTGAAVYVGGHFRWSNNSYGHDSLGQGGVSTPGIAALDPANGLPLLAWNPGRDRGRAVWQILATTNGLYVASDTDRIAGGLYRARIAYFPLAGGASVPQPPRQVLPVTLHNFNSSGDSVVRRSFDGTNIGSPSTVGTVPSLDDVEAATWANGTLYSAHDDGTLRARSFNGTSFGSASVVDLRGMTSFATDLDNMTGMVYDSGNLYYTLSGSSNLYLRHFSTASNVVGDRRFTVASAGGYSDVRNMVIAGNYLYYGHASSGTLRRAPWSGTGANFGSAVTIANANTDGISWTNTTLWSLGSGAVVNQPPKAKATATCAGLQCNFDASQSTDDGGIVSWDWTFGGGGTSNLESPTHTFAAPGTYSVDLTVTDGPGLTDTDTISVTVSVSAGRGLIGIDSETTSNTTSTNTVTVPAGTEAGDQLLLFSTSNGPGSMTLDAPAGWTRVLDANTSQSRSAIWARTATGADAGTSVVVTSGVLSRTDVVIASYRGLALGAGGGTAQTGYTTPTATAPAGAWIVSYWGDKSSTTTGWTAPPGVAVRHTKAGTGSGHVSELLADSNGGVPAGTVGGLTATVAAPVANAVAATLILDAV